MLGVILHGGGEPRGQIDLGLPAKDLLGHSIVAKIVPDVDRLPFGRKRNEIPGSLPVDGYDLLGQILQVDHFAATQIHDLSDGFIARGGQQERVHGIVDVVEIAQLQPIPEDLDGFVGQKLFHPDPQEGLASVLDAHSRSVGVRETQRGAGDAVDLGVEDVVPLARDFVDPVHIDWNDRVFFVDRKILGFAIDLSGRRVDDPDLGVVLAGRFQDGQLGCGVDLKIRERIRHGIHVAGLAGKIEEIILVLDQIGHGVGITDVGNVDLHLATKVLDIGEVAAILRDEAVDQRHLGAESDELARKARADESEASSDQCRFVLEHQGHLIGGHKIHLCL